MFNFHSDAPMLKYRKKFSNSCYFSILASDFASIKQNKATDAISLSIEQPLNIKVGNSIEFANAILKNEKTLKANQESIIVRGNIKIWALMIL